MIREFKEFAFEGNLLDIAVGFVLGIAFAALVTSLVDDVLTPLVAAVIGEPDFSALTITVGESAIRYGAFLNAVISFLVVALALFLFVVKPSNAIRKRAKAEEEEADEEEPAEDIALLTEIRDALRNR